MQLADGNIIENLVTAQNFEPELENAVNDDGIATQTASKSLFTYFF